MPPLVHSPGIHLLVRTLQRCGTPSEILGRVTGNLAPTSSGRLRSGRETHVVSDRHCLAQRPEPLDSLPWVPRYLVTVWPTSRTALIVARDSCRDPGLRRLRAPAADVEALAKVLGASASSGFTVRSGLDQPGHVV